MDQATHSKSWWHRALKRFILTTTVAGAGVVLRMPGAIPPACAAAPPTQKVKTVKKRKKAAQEQASLTKGQQSLATLVLAGGLAYVGVRSAVEEDEEEEVRIREETEKLEKMTKEFTDIDGGVNSDLDLFASLKKRMNATDVPEDVNPDADELPDDNSLVRGICSADACDALAFSCPLQTFQRHADNLIPYHTRARGSGGRLSNAYDYAPQ